MSDYVLLEHRDAANLSLRMGAQPGTPPGYARLYDNELDATGAGMSLADPHAEAELYVPPDETSPSPTAVGNPTNLRGVGCSWNGMPTACGFLMALIAEKAGGVRNYNVAMGSLTSFYAVQVGDIGVKDVGAADERTSGVGGEDATVRVEAGRVPLYRIYSSTSVGLTVTSASTLGGGAGFTTITDPRRASPQNPIRPEEFGEHPERWRILKNLAFADAKDALLADARCRRFLGLSRQQVTGLVRALWRKAQYANLSSDAGTIGEGKSATILLSRRFFSDTAYKAALRGPSAYGPDDPMQWRALTVLHEIAHALNRIPSDKDSISQSLENDRRVYEECQQGISMLHRLGDYGGSIPPPK